MNVRNRIVEAEYAVQLRNSMEYTANKFKDLRPDVLNERKLDGKFWRDYLCPPIQHLSERLSALSPLEKNISIRSTISSRRNFIRRSRAMWRD